jgi:hypothetical protein
MACWVACAIARAGAAVLAGAVLRALWRGCHYREDLSSDKGHSDRVASEAVENARNDRNPGIAIPKTSSCILNSLASR